MYARIPAQSVISSSTGQVEGHISFIRYLMHIYIIGKRYLKKSKSSITNNLNITVSIEMAYFSEKILSFFIIEVLCINR